MVSLGHDVLTSFDAGNANKAIPDEQVLEFAAQEGRILLTFNRKHFIRLHKISDAHAGIVVCTEDPDTEALANRIHDAIVEISEEHLWGQLLRVNRRNR